MKAIQMSFRGRGHATGSEALTSRKPGVAIYIKAGYENASPAQATAR